MSTVRERAHWEVVAEGWHYTREHFVSDPTQFVGHIPVPEYDAAMDALLRDILAIAMLHAKSDSTVEIEVFHDDDKQDECDEWDHRFPVGGCPGHSRDIHICDECGTGTDGSVDGVVWLEWPCRTAKLLGLDS